MDSKAVLQGIRANLMSTSWRVSGKLIIWHSSMVCPFNEFGKIIWRFWILYSFDLLLYSVLIYSCIVFIQFLIKKRLDIEIK